MTRSHPGTGWPEGPVALHPHPVNTDPWHGRLSVEFSQVNAAGGMHLQLEYVLEGPVHRLRLSRPSPHPAFTDNLWQHTCLEAFVGAPDTEAYREFNFAPSGHWAIYDFASCRERTASGTASLPSLAAPSIACHQSEDTLRLTARVPAAALPTASRLRWNLSAVLETLDGQLSYWALAHPTEKPDFHHPKARALLTPAVAP